MATARVATTIHKNRQQGQYGIVVATLRSPCSNSPRKLRLFSGDAGLYLASAGLSSILLSLDAVGFPSFLDPREGLKLHHRVGFVDGNLAAACGMGTAFCQFDRRVQRIGLDD